MLAWLWANFFFIPSLATVGPAGTQADLRGALTPPPRGPSQGPPLMTALRRCLLGWCAGGMCGEPKDETPVVAETSASPPPPPFSCSPLLSSAWLRAGY